ncbi:MAG TPA: SAM-dependent chlorinase/fluorinase, partial [Acidimicrobiales bacterium]|nr:SAM-dependent chlorinase/fluorinase [Acidimicrobiales bacterium]
MYGPGCFYFMSDYGLSAEFAGVVRAVLARDAPGVPTVDLTHAIPPFDVRAGALTLARCAPHLGPGIVLAVVDPGVGTARRAIALESADDRGPRHLLGPDNGLLVWAAELLGGIRRAVELEASPMTPKSSTFDGRDVFGPAAASLSRGTGIASLGDS